MGGDIRPPPSHSWYNYEYEHMIMNICNKLTGAMIPFIVCASVILSSCADKSFTPPLTFYVTPSLQVDLYQLRLDYYNNAAAADTAYSGKRYYFGLVRADQVSSIFDVRNSEDYILVDNVKFKPRATADMRGIIQGTVFEVIGDVQGMQSGCIVVNNCWFRIQSGGATFPSGGAY
jgi:hypothetical protein